MTAPTFDRFAYAHGSAELRALIEGCEQQTLTAWETGFVNDMRKRRYAPTDKQWATLRKIAAGSPDYEAIAAAALRSLPEIIGRWFPEAVTRGREMLACNPKRSDKTLGSFSININTGQWSDFATGDGGGDLISLAAWLFDLKQPEAARRVAAMVGLDGGAQ